MVDFVVETFFEHVVVLGGAPLTRARKQKVVGRRSSRHVFFPDDDDDDDDDDCAFGDDAFEEMGLA